MLRSRQRRIVVAGLGVLALVLAAFFWLSRTWTVNGEISDTALVLSPDHAGAVVNFELRNVGSEPCDLVVVLTSLPADALPVERGRVDTYNGTAIEMGPNGSLPTGVPIMGTGREQSVGPGDVARLQVAFESTPRTDNLVVLCNGEGQYQAGRRATLTFDR